MGALARREGLKRALIVAPTSVCGVWPEELESGAAFEYHCINLTGTKENRLKLLRGLAATEGLQVAVINYESAWRPEILAALKNWKPELVIADESQRIKNPTAAQSKGMHQLGDVARWKLILSGTPVQNAAIDLWSQYRFLDPSVFGNNFYAFRNRYAVMGGFQRHQIIGYRNMDELVRREHSIAYRVTKEEALDLPEQTFENRYVELPAEARALYKRIQREGYAELMEDKHVTAATVLTKLIRLQQLTGGFMRADEAAEPEFVHKAKLDALMEIIGDVKDAGKKVVVFARFTAEIDLICKALQDAKIHFGVIDGRTPTVHKTDALGRDVPSRDEVVADFQGNPDTMVFVAQIQTAGLGITLHAASTAVFYSLDYNYANYSQALARIHRIGQHHPCTYINLVVPGTIDAKILKALDAKQDLAKTVVDDWRILFKEGTAQ